MIKSCEQPQTRPQTLILRDVTFETERNRILACIPSRRIFSGWGPKLFLSLTVVSVSSGLVASRANALTTSRPPATCKSIATSASIDAPPAEIPDIARAMQISGTAVIRVKIDEAGSLIDAGVLASTGNIWLDAEALRVTHVARYGPATEKCRPVPSVAKVEVSFNR